MEWTDQELINKAGTNEVTLAAAKEMIPRLRRGETCFVECEHPTAFNIIFSLLNVPVTAEEQFATKQITHDGYGIPTTTETLHGWLFKLCINKD